MKDWRFGSLEERKELIDFLWNKSGSLTEKDPDGAKVYAWGALVLAAHEGFGVGTLAVRTFGQNVPRLQRIAQLNDKQVKSLTSLVSLLEKEAGRTAKAGSTVIRAEAALIQEKARPLPPELVENSLKALSEMRNTFASLEGPRSFAAYQLVFSAWSLRNLVHAHGDDKSKMAVDGLLKDWRAQAEDSSVERRWFDEALAVIDKPLITPRIFGPGMAKSQEQPVLRRAARAFRKPLGIASLVVIAAILCLAKWRSGRGRVGPSRP